tara:strand:- start:436 stop:1275 length:840 start_codon:yes stop_codon:yes gene_type:complete
MSRILITGANGFLGREAVKYFTAKDSHTVFQATRQTLDLLDPEAVKDWVSEHDIDVIIHTAIQYGDTLADLIVNLTMYHTLSQSLDEEMLMIYYGSGAEYDNTKDIKMAAEGEVISAMPATYYALGKNLMTRHAARSDKNIINLRLFGCFGPGERESRFVANSMTRAQRGEPIRIYQNREMDFMYVGDVMKVTDYVLENTIDGKINGHRDINLCYKNKLSLLDIATLICYTMNTEVPIIIEDPSTHAPTYTGDATRLYELDLDLLGLQEGIKEVYDGNR